MRITLPKEPNENYYCSRWLLHRSNFTLSIAPMEITVLILTPLPLEYEAVIKHLTGERKTIFRDQANYERWEFQGKHHHYKVIVREPGMKNVDMALATERAIQSFQPHIALLIGIAGGVKDVQIGDVVVATSAFSYDAGKESEHGFLARPAEYTFSEELLARAQALRRDPAWKQRTSDGAPHAAVLIGPIAAGDKVVAGTNNPTYQRITQNLSHIKALEMEADGFGLAIQPHRNLHALAIRGISDLCAGKAETDQQNWQPVAAERAAAFAMELLWQLDAAAFLQIHTMETKALVKEIYGLLFPAALQATGGDFADAPSPEIRQIWQKVQPFLREEVQALANDPDDVDAQADVRNRLKKEVEKRGDLAQGLTGLLTASKKESAPGSVSIKDSKNVIVGSQISVGGNFRLGDG